LHCRLFGLPGDPPEQSDESAGIYDDSGQPRPKPSTSNSSMRSFCGRANRDEHELADAAGSVSDVPRKVPA